MATVDEVTGNGPEFAETVVIHTLQLLEWICARDESGKRHGRRRLRQWSQQASMTQGQVRSGVSLVDMKLVTKHNAFSGERGRS